MKTKHTEGPWTIHIGNNNLGSIQAGNAKLILMFDPEGENLANAHLIATAPELLDAVRSAHDYLCDKDPRADRRHEIKNLLENLINKVKGDL